MHSFKFLSLQSQRNDFIYWIDLICILMKPLPKWGCTYKRVFYHLVSFLFVLICFVLLFTNFQVMLAYISQYRLKLHKFTHSLWRAVAAAAAGHTKRCGHSR